MVYLTDKESKDVEFCCGITSREGKGQDGPDYLDTEQEYVSNRKKK